MDCKTAQRSLRKKSILINSHAKINSSNFQKSNQEPSQVIKKLKQIDKKSSTVNLFRASLNKQPGMPITPGCEAVPISFSLNNSAEMKPILGQEATTDKTVSLTTSNDKVKTAASTAIDFNKMACSGGQNTISRAITNAGSSLTGGAQIMVSDFSTHAINQVGMRFGAIAGESLKVDVQMNDAFKSVSTSPVDQFNLMACNDDKQLISTMKRKSVTKVPAMKSAVAKDNSSQKADQELMSIEDSVSSVTKRSGARRKAKQSEKMENKLAKAY